MLVSLGSTLLPLLPVSITRLFVGPNRPPDWENAAEGWFLALVGILLLSIVLTLVVKWLIEAVFRKKEGLDKGGPIRSFSAVLVGALLYVVVSLVAMYYLISPSWREVVGVAGWLKSFFFLIILIPVSAVLIPVFPSWSKHRSWRIF